jgi:hypothetical protein
MQHSSELIDGSPRRSHSTGSDVSERTSSPEVIYTWILHHLAVPDFKLSNCSPVIYDHVLNHVRLNEF